jgi:hypothetical protein
LRVVHHITGNTIVIGGTRDDSQRFAVYRRAHNSC